MNEFIETARQDKNAEELPSGKFTDKPAKTSVVILNVDTSKKMLQFTMTKESGEDSTNGSDQDGHFLYIGSGEYIELIIKLSKDYKWKFAAKDPISFKVKSDAGHYKLASFSSDSITIWAKSTDAKPKPPTADGAISHGFNLYILLEQTPLKAFPVRLDPDLKNPPPPLLHAVITGPVPIV